MRFLGKVSLSLIFLTFPYLLPSSAKFTRCDWVALGSDVQILGVNGSDGKNGQRGKNAQNTESLTIFTDGSPMNLNLAGKNGENGNNGENGQDAKCSPQPQGIEANLQAANGGNGGNGGDGGDGGNGGDLSIYATNLPNLKQITVNALGGKGGQPGKGGQGAKGCNCTEPYWTRETCKGKPGDANYQCSTQQFRCQNGSNGVNGIDGRIGRDGQLGKLTIINLNRPLTEDKPSATVNFSQLKDRGFILSKNKWETRTGALSLFAPGSVIDDEYRILVERLERSFLLIWNAPQSFDKFANQRLTLSLDDNQAIAVDMPKSVWIEGTTQQKNNVSEFVVYNAILESEVTQLESKGITGNRTDLKLTLIDRANLSNLIGTKFNIKYQITRSDPRFRPVSDYSTKFEGEIPTDLIFIQGNKFILNLGKLPIDPEYLKPGLGFEIDITATRSFAGYSKDQNLIIRDVIPGLR